MLRFYKRVADLYRVPGQDASSKLVLTPVMADWEATLRIYRYPKQLWPWLIQHATSLFNWHRKERPVDWIKELGKPLNEVTPEDLGCGAK